MVTPEQEIGSWDIVRRMPLPIAYVYQQYRATSDQDVFRKASLLFSVAEVTTRYLAALLSANFFTEPADAAMAVPEWIRSLPIGKRSHTFGRWIGAFRDLGTKMASSKLFVPELSRTCHDRQTMALIDRLGELRNDLFHQRGGFGPPDDEVIAISRDARPTLYRWLEAIRYLADYPLCLSIRRNLFNQSASSSYYVKRCMGLASNHRELLLRTDFEVKEHQPFIVNRDADALLYLWPFLVSGQPGPAGGFGVLHVFDGQAAPSLGVIQYSGIGSREDFAWTAPQRDPSLQWLWDERRHLPGVLHAAARTFERLVGEPLDPMVGATVGGARRFELIGRLGEGAMGVVYIARDPQNQRVAVKLLKAQHDPTTVRRFEQEIERLGRIGGTEGIVGLLDWGTAEDGQGNLLPFYAMEFAERGDLATFIHQACVALDSTSDPAEWDLEPRLAALEQLAHSLATLHEKGLVHRDIKPGNVLLMTDGTIRLADFGLAKLLAPGGTAGAMSIMSIVGTLDYLPPEQLVAGAPTEPTWDVFSFGVLTFELLFCRLPKRHAPSDHGTGGETLQEQRALQRLPPTLRRLINRCTSAAVADRYPDGTALFAALAEALENVRRAELVVHVGSPDTAVTLDDKPCTPGVSLSVTSGAHVVSMTTGTVVGRPRVVRIAPLAKLNVLLTLDDEELKQDGAEANSAAPASVRQYLNAIQLRLVTRAVSYGTTREVEDRNSHEIWRLLKHDLGDSGIALLLEVLDVGDPELRMKALTLLLYYAGESPAVVDHAHINRLMAREEVPTVLRLWINYLQLTIDSQWAGLIELMQLATLGTEAAAIPALLGRRVSQGDDVANDILSALVASVREIPDGSVRAEVVRLFRGGTSDAEIALREILRVDVDMRVRAAAAFSLSEHASPGVFEELLAAIHNDGSQPVRVAAARALMAMAPERAEREFARIRAGGDSAARAAVGDASRL